MRSVVACTLLSGLIAGLCVRDISVSVVASQAGEQSSEGSREAGLIARIAALEKTSVLPGMIIPYFGKELPEGYVWADGRTQWPREDWVPEHIRGLPVPNLMEERMFLGATPVEGEVGKRSAAGSLVIDGDRFPMPGLVDRIVFNWSGANNGVGGIFPSIDIVSGTNGSIRSIFGPSQVAGALRDMGNPGLVGALYHQDAKVIDARRKPPAPILGTQTIRLDSSANNNMHYMARWIIRIKK